MSVIFRIFYCVTQKVDQDLNQLFAVTVDFFILHMGSVYRKGNLLGICTRQDILTDGADDLLHPAGGLHHLRVAGFDSGNLQDMIDQTEQVITGGVDFVQIILNLFRMVRMASGKRSIAGDGVQRGAHVVGHIGEKGTFGNVRQTGLVPCVLKYFFLFHLMADLIIHPAGTKDDTGDPVCLPYVRDTKL